jgi:hypothetical protein
MPSSNGEHLPKKPTAKRIILTAFVAILQSTKKLREVA